MSEKFDIAVIGSGPGGFAAAIRCAAGGAAVAILEKGDIGGVCLNCGCIPSKALLASTHFLTLAKNAGPLGIEIDNPRINWSGVQTRKETIVAGFRKGMTAFLQRGGIKIFKGAGLVTAPNRIAVKGEDSAEIETSRIIIATGSVPVEIETIPFDGKTIIDSTRALLLPEIPQSMVIVGAGAVGCEMACIYAAAGSKVTIIEALTGILPFEDEWVGRILTGEFKKLGIDVITGKKVAGCKKADSKAVLFLEDGTRIEAEKVLVAVGRKAFCDNATAKNLSLEMNGSAIKVNENMETSTPGIFAIGDVVGTTYLAHGAFLEAQVAAENAMGKTARIKDYSLVPRTVYTFCEVASVGRNEGECRAEGIDCKIGRAFFKNNGRSVGYNEIIGQVRVISEKRTGKVLGVTMVGYGVTEMIATARALLGSSENISEISFAHPTVCEVLKEAWEDSLGTGLYSW